jgi:hypothetical protein
MSQELIRAGFWSFIIACLVLSIAFGWHGIRRLFRFRKKQNDGFIGS